MEMLAGLAFFGITLGLMVANDCPTWGWLAWSGTYVLGNLIGFWVIRNDL